MLEKNSLRVQKYNWEAEALKFTKISKLLVLRKCWSSSLIPFDLSTSTHSIFTSSSFKIIAKHKEIRSTSSSLNSDSTVVPSDIALRQDWLRQVVNTTRSDNPTFLYLQLVSQPFLQLQKIDLRNSADAGGIRVVIGSNRCSKC